jgi:hypothetical protein
LHLTQSSQGIDVLIPNQKAVIPMLINPTFEQPIDDRKIDYPTEFIDFGSRDIKFRQVIVTVKVRTFALMAQQTVASAKGDFSHHSDLHVVVSVFKLSEFGSRGQSRMFC